MIELLTDKDKASKILKSYFKSYQVSDDPFEKIAAYIVNGDITGIISYSIIYERAEINYIVVSDNNRRNGIGSRVLEYALNDMKKNGCAVVSLEVSLKNEAAINLYLKYGFKNEAIRNNYYEDSDGYLMIKSLEAIK